ncbi:MAG: gliding motility-associated C-terminal domain-containing protein, partial [Flavobacteriales bacterium]|nr:gliding motility-associated C-terminal domain-containing protein [Flavobacteriales bacterium]
DSISVSSAGTYWVDAILNGCSARDSINVQEIPLPVVSLGPDLQVCPGGTATLDATTAGGSYLWSNGAATPTLSAGVGTWSVDVTVNGCTGSDAATISELTPPSVDLGPDTLLCPGETLLLDVGSTGASYLWSSGTTGPSITVTSAGTVSVTVTDAQSCTASDAITVSFADPGSISLGPDISFCAGDQVTLDASVAGASSYAWSDGTWGPVLSTSVGGTYWVQITQGNCLIGDTIELYAVPSPSITLGNDTTLCPGETWELQVPATGLDLEWQDGSQGSSFVVDAAGEYRVIATNAAGCSDTSTVQVSYMGANAFNLGNDTLICAGSSLILDAGLPGGSTQWSGASTAPTPSIPVTATGIYIATTTVAGCAFTDSIQVSVIAPPVLDLGPDINLCTGSTLELSVNAPSVLWDDGSTAAVRTIDQGGAYWVQASVNGCTSTDTVSVTEIPLPPVQLGPDTGLCSSELLTLNVSVPGGSYLWNDGSTAAERSVPPGTWHVQVTVQECSARDTIQIGALPSPTLQLPLDTILCAGTTWTIDVNQPGSSYLWTTGSTSSSMMVSDAGNYGVTVDLSGCTASASVEVGYVDLSQFDLGPDTTLCPGNTLELHVDIPGASVLWQDGSTALQRTVASTGTFQATVSVGGCSAQSSVQVDFTPVPLVFLGPDRTMCIGDTVLLTIDPGQAQPVWSTGGNGNDLNVTTTGAYSVSLALDGCTTADTVLLTFRPVINQLDLGPDQEVCSESPVIVDATIPGAAYTWSNGSHQPTLALTEPGIYSVVVTGPCINVSDTIVITKGNCAPVVHIPNAFTPDGDEVNDVFAPVVFEPVRSWTFLIFDRWGELIFSSDVPGGAWDGIVNGRDAQVGVYVWDLHYEAVTSGGVVQKRQRGSVVLVR